MRRKDREVTDRAEIAGMLGEQSVCRLAMIADGRPYVVPLNYGWEWSGEELLVYVHCALGGRFPEALQSAPAVCFEVDSRHALIGSQTACRHSYTYASVIADGTAEFLTDADEMHHALSVLMENVTGQKKDWEFEAPMLKVVRVIRVRCKSWAAKKREK